MWTSSRLWVRHYGGYYPHLAGLVGVVMALCVSGDDSKGPRRVVRCHSGGGGVSPPPSSSCGCRRKQLEAFLRKSDKQIDWDRLPVYTSTQVAQHNGGTDSADVWMSYGGFVYNVTSFIPFHPGGTERISRAAGAANGSVSSPRPAWRCTRSPCRERRGRPPWRSCCRTPSVPNSSPSDHRGNLSL